MSNLNYRTVQQWNGMFAQSNQGMEFNQAKMLMAQGQQQSGKKEDGGKKMLRMAGNALKFLKGNATNQDLALRLGMDAVAEQCLMQWLLAIWEIN